MDLIQLKKSKKIQTIKTILKSIFPIFFPFWFLYWLGKLLYGKYNHYITKVYIVSYPCSGRTWLRTILAKLFSLKFNTPLSLDIFSLTKEYHLPVMKFTHAGSDVLKQGLASQKPVKEDFKKFKNKKIIFLVRDPRDAIVSYYFEVTKRQKVYHGDVYRGELSQFIRDPYFGVERIINFLNFWSKNKNFVKGFLLIRYEDLHQNAFAQISKLLKFVNLTGIEDSLIKEAIDSASFDKMRKMEKNDILDTPFLRPANKSDKESFKVRKGKVGGYKDYLKSNDIRYLNQQLKKLDSYFGYK